MGDFTASSHGVHSISNLFGHVPAVAGTADGAAAGRSRAMEHEIWHSRMLGGCDGVCHGTASCAFGLLNYARGRDGESRRNRQRLAELAGFSADSVTMVRQVHGACVRLITRSEIGNGAERHSDELPECDAMVSREPGVTLVVRTNDCVPVLILDRASGAIGAAHAGWRGVLGGVVGNTLEAMGATFGTRARDLNVALGPSICGRHYDMGPVSAEPARLFCEAFPDTSGVTDQRSGRVFVDLARAVRLQLMHGGVPDSSIDTCPHCTYEHHDRYPSYRANGGRKPSFSIWSFIGRQAGSV